MKIKQDIIATLGLALALGGCASLFTSGPSTTDYINSAQTNLNNKQYTIALESANLAVKSDPKNYIGYYLQAQAYQQLQQLTQANKSYQQATNLNSNNGKLYADYATSLCAAQNYPLAMANYTTAAQIVVQNKQQPTNIYTATGDCLISQNQSNNAIDYYIKALKDESAPLSAYLGISYAYVLEKNYDVAHYYISLYTGTDNIQSLQMKIMVLNGMLESNQKLSNRAQLQKSLSHYQAQLQQLLPSSKTTTISGVIDNNDTISIKNNLTSASTATTKVTPPVSSKLIKVKTTAAADSLTKPPIITAPVAKNSKELAELKSYPELQPRIKKAPDGHKYIIVSKGDTLYNLALRSNTSQEQLIKINKLTKKEVELGRKLYLD